MPLSEKRLRELADEEDKHPSVSAGVRGAVDIKDFSETINAIRESDARIQRYIERLEAGRREDGEKIVRLIKELSESNSMLMELLSAAEDVLISCEQVEETGPDFTCAEGGVVYASRLEEFHDWLHPAISRIKLSFKEEAPNEPNDNA